MYDSILVKPEWVNIVSKYNGTSVKVYWPPRGSRHLTHPSLHQSAINTLILLILVPVSLSISDDSCH